MIFVGGGWSANNTAGPTLLGECLDDPALVTSLERICIPGDIALGVAVGMGVVMTHHGARRVEVDGSVAQRWSFLGASLAVVVFRGATGAATAAPAFPISAIFEFMLVVIALHGFVPCLALFGARSGP